MPLSKLQFRPGIVREVSEYSNSGGWYDADKIRFRAGYPEKIGGWQAVVRDRIEGVCRHLHYWSDWESDRYMGLGTSSHLYLLYGEQYFDLTPLRDTNPTIALGADPFWTGAVDTNQVGVHIPNHGAQVGDWVVFSGATTPLDVYSPQILNQAFPVWAVFGTESLGILMPTSNISQGSATGGGPNVTASFLVRPGLDDAIIGQGWGIPPWNAGDVPPGSLPLNWQVGWGQPFDPRTIDPANPNITQLRLWDLDNFGDDLVANIRGGPIYYWHHAAGHTSRAVRLDRPFTFGGNTFTPNQVPTVANQTLVSPNDRHLVAMGCDWPETGVHNQDFLLVRWSSEEDAYTWEPLRTNSAGSQRLSAGSFIICGMRTRSEILIWTDLGLWAQRYIGMPYVFGFDLIAEGLSIIGPNAMVNAGNVVLWMDRGIFYAYTGQVQELPCPVKDYIFHDFNYIQGYKVYAGHNHAFSEVIWFYPSASQAPDQENDRYVIYNYVDQLWSIGTIERTSWLDMGRANYPVATDRKESRLFYHELGHDDNGGQLPAYIDSADIDIDGGEHYLFLSRFIPDMIFRGNSPNQSVGVTIFGRSAPNRRKEVKARLEINPNSPEQYIRVRERQISFRIESTGVGVGWRLGTLRTDMQPDGRR